MYPSHPRLTRRLLLAAAISAPGLVHSTGDRADTSKAYVKVHVTLEKRKTLSKSTQSVDLVLPMDKSTQIKIPSGGATPLQLKLQPVKASSSGLLLQIALSRGEPAELLHQPNMGVLTPWDKPTSLEFGHHDGETISLVLSPSTLPATYQPTATPDLHPAVRSGGDASQPR